MKPLIKNKKGASLIELTIYVGLISLFTGFAALVAMRAQDSFKYIQQDLEVDLFHSTVGMLLANPLACFESFKNTDIVAGNSDGIILRRSDTAAFLQQGDVRNTNITIDRIRAKNFQALPEGAVPLPFTGRFTVEILYSYPVGTTGEVRQVTRAHEVRSAPSNPLWPAGAGVKVTNNTYNCTAGSGSGIVFDSNKFISKERNDLKLKDLTIDGTLEVIGQTTANGYLEMSDSNLKSNIKKFFPNRNLFGKINGYKFKWKRNYKSDYGFIAQEVEPVLPNLVQTDLNKIKKVNYNHLLPFVLGSTNETHLNNKEMKKKIQSLNQILDQKNNGR